MGSMGLRRAANFLVCLGMAASGAGDEPATRDGDTTATSASDALDEPIRPQGTLVRPSDGVQDPVLDQAWADYDAVIAKASKRIRDVISKQFATGAAQGDLAIAEKWQALEEAFVTRGILPADKATEKEVKAATESLKLAGDRLRQAYDTAKEHLTKAKRIEDAKKVRAEWAGLSASRPERPKPDQWKAIFDGATKNGWGGEWGVETLVEDGALRLSGEHSGITHNDRQGSDCAFEATVRVFNRRSPNARAKLCLQATETGALVLEANGAGQGRLGRWDNVAKQWHNLADFRYQAAANAWQTWELRRSGNQLRVVIDGREAAVAVVPADVLPLGFVQVGVHNADVAFKELRVKSLK